MKMRSLAWLVAILVAFGLPAMAQTTVTGTYKHIAVDGSFGDWAGVPLAYNAPTGSVDAIQYENVYIANDENNIYIRFTLYAPRAAFANSYDNIFIDTDNNPATGFSVGGIGSSMLIQWGGGYQENNGQFNIGGVNNLGWAIAGSPDNLSFEIAISRAATFASDSSPVFTSDTLAILMEGDNTSYVNTEFVPPTGGLVYTMASAPTPPATNLTLVSLGSSSWKANAAGSDLGTNWLDSAYDDSGAGWVSGNGLFGYTTSPGSYPAIQTALASGPTTYYFRTHFEWTNNPANVAFVVTNYLSDGAVLYLNGFEVRRVRMPSGAIGYSTAAAATNSPLGHADVFGIDGSGLQLGDNILEVETHQAPGSTADMVFGLSLTAAIHYPVYLVDSSLPTDQLILAGQPVQLTSDVVGSGPLTYQWFNGANAISGATDSSYSIPLVLQADAGQYSLRVSNAFSYVITRSASLTVSNIAVSISTQPANQVVMEGKPATLTVGVAGTPIIQYQWSFGGVPIPDGTNASYTIAYSRLTNGGSYQVTVSNPAGSTNSSTANLTVLRDTIPPTISSIAAGQNQLVITFTEPVDAVTGADPTKYNISGGVLVTGAVLAPGNAAQVTLTTSTPMVFGTVYTLSVNGVKDLFGNAAHVAGQFTRRIVIDGLVDDWAGLTPVYTSDAPSGQTGAADFKDIYVYSDADYYYFRVTLWTDINPGDGQFPFYVNMFFDTDNNSGTGYAALGSELLVQSGYSYQEKNGSFNDNFPINDLNWLSLPASPGTNFEFRMSRAATFQDATLVFSTNQINFVFQGMTSGFVVENTVPSSGVISYTNANEVSVAALPVSQLAVAGVPGAHVAVVWDGIGTLQQAGALTGGSWTNLPAATSPYVLPVAGAKQSFFRLTH